MIVGPRLYNLLSGRLVGYYGTDHHHYKKEMRPGGVWEMSPPLLNGLKGSAYYCFHLVHGEAPMTHTHQEMHVQLVQLVASPFSLFFFF